MPIYQVQQTDVMPDARINGRQNAGVIPATAKINRSTLRGLGSLQGLAVGDILPIMKLPADPCNVVVPKMLISWLKPGERARAPFAVTGSVLPQNPRMWQEEGKIDLLPIRTVQAANGLTVPTFGNWFCHSAIVEDNGLKTTAAPFPMSPEPYEVDNTDLSIRSNNYLELLTGDRCRINKLAFRPGEAQQIVVTDDGDPLNECLPPLNRRRCSIGQILREAYVNPRMLDGDRIAAEIRDAEGEVRIRVQDDETTINADYDDYIRMKTKIPAWWFCLEIASPMTAAQVDQMSYLIEMDVYELQNCLGNEVSDGQYDIKAKT